MWASLASGARRADRLMKEHANHGLYEGIMIHSVYRTACYFLLGLTGEGTQASYAYVVRHKQWFSGEVLLVTHGWRIGL